MNKTMIVTANAGYFTRGDVRVSFRIYTDEGNTCQGVSYFHLTPEVAEQLGKQLIQAAGQTKIILENKNK